MRYLSHNNKASHLPHNFVLPEGFVFATRAVTKAVGTNPEILSDLKVTLKKQPADLVWRVAKLRVNEVLNAHPETRGMIGHDEFDHMVHDNIKSLKVGIIRNYRSEKLQEKYFNTGIASANLGLIDHIDPSILSQFHIIDGIGDYAQTKSLIHDTVLSTVLILSKSKIEELVKQIEKKEAREFKTIGAFVKGIYSQKGKLTEAQLKSFYSEDDIERLKELGFTKGQFSVEHRSPFILP